MWPDTSHQHTGPHHHHHLREAKISLGSVVSPMMGDTPSGVVARRTCPSRVGHPRVSCPTPPRTAEPCTEDTAVNNYMSRAAPRSPEVGSWMVWWGIYTPSAPPPPPPERLLRVTVLCRTLGRPQEVVMGSHRWMRRCQASQGSAVYASGIATSG